MLYMNIYGPFVISVFSFYLKYLSLSTTLQLTFLNLPFSFFYSGTYGVDVCVYRLSIDKFFFLRNLLAVVGS